MLTAPRKSYSIIDANVIACVKRFACYGHDGANVQTHKHFTL